MDNISKLLNSYTACKDVLAKEPERIIEFFEAFLAYIEQGKALNAFVRVYDQEVRQQTRLLENKLREKRAGYLTGMGVGLKDNILYKDHPVQASSRILEGFIAQFSATVVERLLKEDAIIIGHQNGDEFGMGSASENSVYGAVHNALDTTRVAGGSSGGSAASLQAHMCHVSLGTDTGGSLRQPAAFCGLVGLKPTYSLVPRDGVIAYASSFDTVGVLAHNITDCATTLKVIAGESKYDNTSSSRAVPDYPKQLVWEGKAKIAYLRQAFESKGLDPCIRQHSESLLKDLAQEGHEVTEVDFPLLPYALPTYYILTTAEASANLARYDGVRYGYRATEGTASSLRAMYKRTRTKGFGKEVQRRILLGTFVLSASYYDAYYLQAQKVRRLIKEHMDQILKSFDFILLPTTPTTAFPHDRPEPDPITAYLADLYTVPASLTGLPALSFPHGKDKNGLPIGIQLITNAFQESKLFAFGQYLMDMSKARDSKSPSC